MAEQNIRLVKADAWETVSGHSCRGNVIICPGGGYQWHSPREAEPVARAFAAKGWKPWILYYPLSENGEVLGLKPLRCVAEAVKQVRKEEPEEPVVLCGFSAGGHVAASLGVHWNDSALFTEKEQKLIRPDGLVLCYPVITAGSYAHAGSIRMLAGPDYTPSDSLDEKAAYFSLEHYVTPKTPPVFLWHTAADPSVPVQNTLLFASSLAANHVPFEVHIYPHGEHGLSLATSEVEDPAKNRFADAHVAGWFEECAQWLERLGEWKTKQK